MSTDRLRKTGRLQDMYAGAAIALVLLVAGANGAWVPALAVAALGIGLLLFPAQRRTILLTAAVAALVSAALALGPRL
jgi:hypothetical protein